MPFQALNYCIALQGIFPSAELKARRASGDQLKTTW